MAPAQDAGQHRDPASNIPKQLRSLNAAVAPSAVTWGLSTECEDHLCKEKKVTGKGKRRREAECRIRPQPPPRVML